MRSSAKTSTILSSPQAFRNTSCVSAIRNGQRRVGLAGIADDEWVAHFGRFEPLPGSFPKPLALRYHGHQFGHYNPDLGDGRGFLFAQLHDLQDGRLLDLGTKGSGTTPWSRAGDGRLTLKGGVREILATAMLESLGVYTRQRPFSMIETGEDLFRGDEPSPTRSSVLVRLSHSHIRIGSFQRLAYTQDVGSLRTLLNYTVRTYMPECWRDDEAERAKAFLVEVCTRVARLGAQWMLAGFVHGVLNTDNINVTGESFDYGPWRFLPAYDAKFTAAYFDHSGLYAYGRQPDTLLWNLARLAECLLPLAPQDGLEGALQGFVPHFRKELRSALLRRLGLAGDGDPGLNDAVWAFLQESQAPFEQFLFDWYGGLTSESRAFSGPSAAFYAGPKFEDLKAMLATYESTAKLDHPYFSRPTPCSMLIEEVERLWAPIAENDDWSVFEAKLAAIQEMREAYGR